ncbi:MAG: hypothetical protein UX68_C0010G0057 [Parcubacteria group bacterium GW2011_GWA2_46_9]|nr:MAG: hypothetical protein UX68_C0010G0057 [Parcubacteria group bacterium GW2011_GWA2_46_9]
MLVAAMANLLIAGLKELGRGRSWDLNQIQELRVRAERLIGGLMRYDQTVRGDY